jgi:hypothetical protein
MNLMTNLILAFTVMEGLSECGFNSEMNPNKTSTLSWLFSISTASLIKLLLT